MVSIEEVIAVENRYSNDDEASLGEAFELLRARWRSGYRDRETALRLMFLIWYALAEPQWLTGLTDDAHDIDLFEEAFRSCGGKRSNDPEFCYVVGLMAELFPWCLRDEKRWARIGKKLSRRAKRLRPEGFTHAEFEGRGAYGEYFAHMTEPDFHRKNRP